MTGKQIIDKFNTYTDDNSELSSQEELDLLNKIYQDVYTERHWEWLKTQSAGNLTSFVAGNAYITMPSDFLSFAENNNMTDNTFEPQNNAAPKVVYIITPSGAYIPYQVVNFSDRRAYINRRGFCYLDIKNAKIIFTVIPEYQQYEFDYIARPAALTLATSPIFNADFQHIIYHGMAVDEMILEMFDRAHSYAAENRAAYASYMAKLAWENSQYLMN